MTSRGAVLWATLSDIHGEWENIIEKLWQIHNNYIIKLDLMAHIYNNSRSQTE